MKSNMADKNLGEYIFHFDSSYSLEKGRLLIASPFLRDFNFTHSVVLLTEYSSEGAVGLVLNKPIQIPATALWEGLSFNGAFLGHGGPVQNDTLHLLHRRPEILGGEEIIPGIYWQGDFEKMLDGLIDGELNPSDVKIFLGYSGWGQGQLEYEVSEQSWIVAPASPKQVFEQEAGRLWKNTLENLGTKYKIISKFPLEPRWN